MIGSSVPYAIITPNVDVLAIWNEKFQMYSYVLKRDVEILLCKNKVKKRPTPRRENTGAARSLFPAPTINH